MTASRNQSSSNPRPGYTETERYAPEKPAAGEVLDRVAATTSRVTVTRGSVAPQAGSTSYAHDLLGHLTRVTRSAGEGSRSSTGPGASWSAGRWGSGSFSTWGSTPR